MFLQILFRNGEHFHHMEIVSVSGLVRQKENMQFVRVTRKQAKMCILTEFFAETFAFATKAERTLFFLFASFASHSVEKQEFYSHSGYILWILQCELWMIQFVF